MDHSGTADSGTDGSQRQDGAADRPDAAPQDDPGQQPGPAPQGADGGAPARQGLVRYARPALIAGGVIAVVCVALLVIIFLLDSFNATVYSVGGTSVTDATDEAKAIRENYAGVRTGGVIFLVLGMVLAAAGALVLYRHRNEAGSDEEDNGEDVDFEDLGGR